MKESTVSWQYRIVLSAVAAASLNLSGILIGSGMPTITLGVLTAMLS